MEVDNEDELYYIDENPTTEVESNIHSHLSSKLLSSLKVNSKSLGTWYFDKRHRKRTYVSLTGKIHTGAEAMKVARSDQFSEKNPANSARFELKYNISILTAEHIYKMKLLPSPSNSLHPLMMLSNWGMPTTILHKYIRNKVSSLFQWQIDCLTVNNCICLTGKKHLIYSAPTSGGKTLVSEILMLRTLAQYMASHNEVRKQDYTSTTTMSTDGTTTITNSSKNRHTIFFIVPFVALAEEKALYFQDIWADMNIGVKAFHGDGGDITGNQLSEDIQIAVCTIERANILLTTLLDENREDQLKMVVIDEIHMLADPHRGFLLEVILTKIKYLLNDKVQIVGMSATLPNIMDLAHWLDAELYTTDYRPVDLEVKVCLNRCLYSVSSSSSSSSSSNTTNNSNSSSIGALPVGGIELPQPATAIVAASSVPLTAISAVAARAVEGANHIPHPSNTTVNAPLDTNSIPATCIDTIHHTSALPYPATKPTDTPVETVQEAAIYMYETIVGMLTDDPDGMKRLCLDTLISNKSAMLFCNSKRRCEVCATAIAEAVARHLHELVSNYHADVTVKTARMALIESLSQTQVGLCPILRQSLPYGIAYHHAGLTLDERKLIEEGFRRGLIQVLCTTSTLSAGVNMPAHRVIIRSPRMGDKFLNVAGFRQMCGRAGRMGFDTKGEAILMIAAGSRIEKSVADHLLTADLDPLRSSLHIAAGGGLEKLLLEMVSCGRLRNESAVMAFVDCTLMRVQQAYTNVVDYTRHALIFLKKEQFIQSLSDGELAPSPLGIATTVSGIAPQDAVQILKPLLNARKKLILKGGLHPVFLVTPPSTPIEPDWKNYERILHVLYQEQPDAQAVASYLGIEPGQLCTYAFSNPPRQQPTAKAQLYRRFFSAILLFALTQEWPITRVTQLITSVTRGQLQQLQKDSAVFCGMIVVFCRKLNWNLLSACLEDFSARLNYGVHKDILPLVRLGPEITAARARVLLRNGIECAQDVVFADLETLTELLMESLPYDGTDPLRVTTTSNTATDNSNDNTKGSGSSIGGGILGIAGVKSKEQSRVVCERLGRKIISRARDYLKDEAIRLNMKIGEDA